MKRRISEKYYELFAFRIRKKIAQLIQANKSIVNGKNMVSKIALPDNSTIFQVDKRVFNNIIEESNRIIAGNIEILGYTGNIGFPHSWHTDFKTNFEWKSGTFYRKYDQEKLFHDCDVKAPRELSRSHHILMVALAYYLTKNEKYSSYCVNQILDWISNNPLMFSINWGCTMDVAIRAVNWLYIISLIKDSNHYTEEFDEEINISLYEHGWFIYRNPEKGTGYNHNHYLSDLVGQVYLGIYFQDLEEPKKWLEEAKKEFFREIRLQILPSGMSFERSTCYNRLVLELCVWPIVLLRNHKHEVPMDICYRLENMFEFLMYSLKPDGTSAVIGDQDNGRLLSFGTDESLDFRYLLSLGTVLFNRSDFKAFSSGYNLYSAFSGVNCSKEVFDNLPIKSVNLKSRLFKDIGYAILRDKDNFLLFNCSGMAKYPEFEPGSHTHSDLLSFELYTSGRSFLVDTGTYVYTADLKERMLFRSTKMHNTVVVDGLSQNNLYEDLPWGFDRNAIPRVLEWRSSPQVDKISASHDGYARLAQPIVHIRTITFDKINENWSIVDEFEGDGEHSFEWNFHFDTDIDFEIEDLSARTTNKDGKNISLTFTSEHHLIIFKEKSFISKSYGTKKKSNVLVGQIKGLAPIKVKIMIIKVS